MAAEEIDIMTTPDQRIEEPLTIYGDPGPCVGELLCDRQPADQIAFTVVEPDLSVRQVSYGEL